MRRNMLMLGVSLLVNRAGAQVVDTTDDGPVAIAQREVMRGWSARTVRAGDAVVFPFGRTQPTVTCAPLRACVIELQRGEVVLGTITGDAERWLVDRTATGPGGGTVLMVVKPVACDLTTNLVLSTDRRVYDITLTSPACIGKAGGGSESYARHVSFYYPDELVSRNGDGLTEGGAQGMMLSATSGEGSVRPESLNFSYRWTPDRRVKWNPAQVYDNGVHTYVKLPQSAAHDELPALFLVGSDGKLAILNYAVVGGDTFISDRVLTHAALVAGANGRDGRVDITSDRSPPPR
jgi:type IV secretion system protein VirB9